MNKKILMFDDTIDCTHEEFAEMTRELAFEPKMPNIKGEIVQAITRTLALMKEELKSGEIDTDIMRVIINTLYNISLSAYSSECENPKQFMIDTLIRKNNDYGNSAMQSGLFGVYIRLTDKVSRLNSLSKKDDVNFEPIKDTYLDIAGYSVICLIILKLMEKQNG